MITYLRKGTYTLVETHGQTKVLKLDEQETFAWIWAENIGELLVYSHNPHQTDHILCKGEYTLISVEDEPEFTDLIHLQLEVGSGSFQGYLLPTGLPSEEDKRKRIIPTTEVIM